MMPKLSGAESARRRELKRLSSAAWRRRHPGYWSCAMAIHRCHNPSAGEFRWYGSRGIEVCSEWRVSPLVMWLFVTMEIGLPPFAGAQIDRIDNDRGYEPGNIRWVSRKENARNRRDNVLVDFDGERITVAEALERTGVSRDAFNWRMLHRWPVELALWRGMRWKRPNGVGRGSRKAIALRNGSLF